MLRKLSSLVMAAILTTLGLVSANPATATGNYSEQIERPYDNATQLVIPIADERFVTVSIVEQEQLQANLWEADGTLVTSENLGVYDAYTSIEMDEYSAWTRLPDGTIAVAWVTKYFNSQNHISKTHIVFTDDGALWSEPINPLPELMLSSQDCQMMPSCGYISPSFVSDGLGNMAFSVNKETSTTKETFVTTSSNGATWSNPTRQKPAESNYEKLGMIGLPSGGFISAWSVFGNNNTTTIVVSRTIGRTNAVWGRPHVVEGNFTYLREGMLLRTGLSTVGLFFVNDVGNETSSVYRKDFSETLRLWSDAEILVSEPDGFQFGQIQGSYANNRAALTYNFGIFGSALGKTYLTEIKNGVTQAAVLVKRDDTTQYVEPMFASPLADGTTYVGWAGQYNSAEFARYKDGNLLSTELVPNGFTRSYAKAAVSKNGNIFFEFDHFSPNERRVIMTYRGASAPVASSSPVVRGTAANGKKLSITLPTFLSPSGIGTTTRQWYSCSRAVPANTSVKPSTCSAISKATASTFKVTSKQRGRYITVAVKNTNAVGATTLFAPVSSKAK